MPIFYLIRFNVYISRIQEMNCLHIDKSKHLVILNNFSNLTNLTRSYPKINVIVFGFS